MSLKSAVRELHSRIKALERMLQQRQLRVFLERDIDLPDHLYRTMHALKALGGRAAAPQIAERTGRARAVESGYLCTLWRMGYTTRSQVGKHAIFSIEAKREANERNEQN